MHNVRHGGKLYTITSDADGVVAMEQQQQDLLQQREQHSGGQQSPNLLWTVSAGKNGTKSDPALFRFNRSGRLSGLTNSDADADTRIFIGLNDGHIVAIDTAGQVGQVLWQFQTHGEVFAG